MPGPKYSRTICGECPNWTPNVQKEDWPKVARARVATPKGIVHLRIGLCGVIGRRTEREGFCVVKEAERHE